MILNAYSYPLYTFIAVVLKVIENIAMWLQKEKKTWVVHDVKQDQVGLEIDNYIKTILKLLWGK